MSSSLSRAAKNVIAIALILAAVVAFYLCEQSLSSINDHETTMVLSALEIGQVESVGGKTLEEAYYSAYSSYLSSQAKMNAQSATILARGIELLSVVSLLAGLYILLVVRIEPSAPTPVAEQSLPPL